MLPFAIFISLYLALTIITFKRLIADILIAVFAVFSVSIAACLSIVVFLIVIM